ncbi:MAG: peptidase and in kexin sedolisin, partial [Actinoallomurus sp.]|nr:peptidase and in kexin sedolisin [Actinoallomurus sp.]
TRLYTPASVGPDGGSTPTDTAKNEASATNIGDDASSTTPSKVPDSGAIAAGGTTLDDTLATPADSDRAPQPTTAETRISGFGVFSSGFGTRVDLSAPSDNIIAFSHSVGQNAQAVTVSRNGGTSASAPEIAAAAAVVLQAGRLAGHKLTPAQVRDVLERTGRAVATPPQIDRTLHVGPQIDVTAAVEDVLGGKTGKGTRGGAQLDRLSVAHRVTTGGLGGTYLETTDPNRIDLGDKASGGNGEGLVGPVTFAGDVTGLRAGEKVQYTLTVGSTVFRSDTPAIRVTPTQLLDAAGLPVVSTTDRNITYTYKVLVGGHVRASQERTLAVGPSDGHYVEATAPHAPAVVKNGSSVTVSYDLTGVTGLSDPQLVLSTVGHWSPASGPIFSAAWHQSLTGTTGTVTIPASAFTGGSGLYGIGIAQSAFGGNPQYTTYGEFAPVRVAGSTAAERPDAPTLTGAGGVRGHTAEVTRSAPSFGLGYDVRGVKGAAYAQVEFSAPAPTLYGSYNTFTNANGTTLDNDGVNSPSTAHRTLPGLSGTARLDALDLGLTTSSQYGVRILALDKNHKVIGQASPLSTLALDDGPTPQGSTVLSFAAAGADSVAALRTAAGGTEVRHYSTENGTYGSVITSDSGTGSDYEVIGAAPAGRRVLLVHQASQGADLRVETWNTATGTLVGTKTLPAADYTFVVGRVDATHDRGALLLRAADKSDVVLPVDLESGSAGAPIKADPSDVLPGTYSVLDIDASTGDVYLAKGAPIAICLGGVQVARVNLTTGSVTGAGSMSGCSHGFGSDGDGTLYNLSATSVSTKIVPTSVIGSLNTLTGATGSSITVRKEVPVALAVDGKNQLAVVEFPAPEGTAYFGSQQGLVLDNNATAQMLVIDLKTGTLVRTMNGFTAGGHGGSLVHGGLMNSVQLDPATRTGFTYGAGDGQIQQFSY